MLSILAAIPAVILAFLLLPVLFELLLVLFSVLGVVIGFFFEILLALFSGFLALLGGGLVIFVIFLTAVAEFIAGLFSGLSNDVITFFKRLERKWQGLGRQILMALGGVLVLAVIVLLAYLTRPV